MYCTFLQRKAGMSEMENENDGETESETELGLPLFRPFTRSNYEQNLRKGRSQNWNRI